MKKNGLAAREKVMIAFLVVLLAGVLYYMLFYQPLQTELTSVANQSADLDSQLEVAAAKVASMDAMQAELDEILAQPQDKITEIAPYDNAKVVMSQLNGILSAAQDYSLSFQDPTFGDNGTVRREVSMQFTCADYASAKSIVEALSASHWRCLINSVAVASGAEGGTGTVTAGTGDILSGSVTVNATITFFESTSLEGADPAPGSADSTAAAASTGTAA